MSASGQFHTAGGRDWVEQLRDQLQQEPPQREDAILDAAYDVSEFDATEIDTATMFAYFEGRLSPEEKADLEAEVALSPHALKKLARIGAIVTETVEPPSAESSASPRETQHRETTTVQLTAPRATIGLTTVPRREECTKAADDSGVEFFRSLEDVGDLLRIYHPSASVGALFRLRMSIASGERSSETFVVMRRSSPSTTTAQTTIPAELEQRELDVELIEVAPADLTENDAAALAQSYEHATMADPISVTALHEPRSAWQHWAEGILDSTDLTPAIADVAEGIATT